MSEPSARVGRPTDKMLEFAKNIASRVGKSVTDEIMTDFEACRAFIDENKEQALRPTERQLAFAQRIADEKSVEIPPEALANGRELSKWIDANK